MENGSTRIKRQNTSMSATTIDQVKDYYARMLKSTSDLKTDACCALESQPPYIQEILEQIPDAVLDRFYGCGSPIPPAIEGCTVLDLGCGTGRDSFLCARLVGPRGRVIGVDMTAEQIEVALRYEGEVARRFGYDKPNTTFLQGYIEDLASLGIPDESVDVVISNCVINLAPDKARVFAEIFRVLKPGGELLFADVFADRRLPREWMEDAVLVGECLAGAMYIEDFRRLLLGFGVPDYRIVTSRPIRLNNTEIASKVGPARFSSMTVRIFKLASLEDRCEDYGQAARYRGTIAEHPHTFVLDDHHEFVTGKPALVCGNTAAMLQETRLAPHFEVVGDRSRHYGLFPCGPSEAAGSAPQEFQPGGCC